MVKNITDVANLCEYSTDCACFGVALVLWVNTVKVYDSLAAAASRSTTLAETDDGFMANEWSRRQRNYLMLGGSILVRHCR